MVVQSVRGVLRWTSVHGFARAVLHRYARRGDLVSQIMVNRLAIDPYDAYDKVRAAGPFLDGRVALATARHDVCTAVLRSPDLGLDGRRVQLPLPMRGLARLAGSGPPTPAEPPSLLGIDAPDHTRIRRLVTRAFTARAVEALRQRTRVIADELLDGMAAESTVNLVPRYASQLPVRVISDILCVPAEMREQLVVWGQGAGTSLDLGLPLRQFRRAEADLVALQRWLREHVARVRRDPGDDVLSTIVRAQSEDDGLTADEVGANAMLLLVAGFETTVNLLSAGTALLLANPDQLAVLRADPSRWPRAVDEALRYEAPVQRTGRMVLRDTEVAGRRLRQGTIVMALIGGANHDPAVFADPASFDVTRANAAEHLSFSGGPHYCLGAALARMEGEIGLRALFERFPQLALAGTPSRRGTRTLRGYSSLPVRLSADTATTTAAE